MSILLFYFVNYADSVSNLHASVWRASVQFNMTSTFYNWYLEPISKIQCEWNQCEWLSNAKPEVIILMGKDDVNGKIPFCLIKDANF